MYRYISCFEYEIKIIIILSHIKPLFSKIDIPPFGKLVAHRISLTMFKFHHGQVHLYFCPNSY